MLTDKEIAELRLSVKRTWVPWALSVLSLMLFFGSVARVYLVDVVCKRNGITWSQVWQVQRQGADMNTVYVGAEVRAQEMLHMAYFGLALSVILAAAAVATVRQRRKDRMLLDYIDRNGSPEKFDRHFSQPGKND
jgi:hypothetical protein